MAAKPETNFIHLVNKRVPSAVYRMKNNNQYIGGIPDVWYSGPDGDLWVEYKFLPRTPSRASVDPKKLLSPLQLKWLNDRYAENRNLAVIIGCPDGGVILTNLQWNDELSAKSFISLIRSPTDIAAWIKTQTCN